MAEADSDSSSDLGGEGAMGFFDVVAPTTLKEAEAEMLARRAAAQAGASEATVDDDSDMSSGDTETGAVGLFDAGEEADVNAAVGNVLVDRKLLFGGKTPVKGAPPRTSTQSDIFTSECSAVLSILNYGEDKVITHETDCLRVWDFHTRKPLVRYAVQVRRVRRYNHWLFAVDCDTEDVLQLDLRDAEMKPNRFTGLEDEATAIAINNFVGFGVTLFAITRDSLTYSWRCPPVEASGHTVEIGQRFKGHTQNVTSLDLGDEFLYTSSTDKTVRVWNYDNGKCAQTLAGHTDWVFSVKVIDRLVYSGSRDETVRVWDNKGACISVIKLGAIANGVMLEEPFLYIRDASKRVFMCESKVKASSNKLVGTCEGSAGNVRHMLVYKNVLITCAEGDTAVRVWSAEDGTSFAVLKAHTDTVNGVALFGTGVVLSAGEDGCIRQWDLLKIFEGATAAASAAATPTRNSSASIRDSGSRAMSKMLSALGKPRSNTDSAASPPRKSRLSTLTRPKRADSASPSAPGSPGPAGAPVTGITPALLLQFQRAIKPTLKTHKVKGQFYPGTFNGKDLVAWIKTNVDGMDNPKNALMYGMAMLREGAFEVVVGKALAEKSSVILRLKG